MRTGQHKDLSGCPPDCPHPCTRSVPPDFLAGTCIRLHFCHMRKSAIQSGKKGKGDYAGIVLWGAILLSLLLAATVWWFINARIADIDQQIEYHQSQQK